MTADVRPIVIATDAVALRGSLHLAQGARRDVAVLWCRAIGAEDHGTDAFGRDLASHLAGQGVAVLRYDHAATGESAGAAVGDDALGPWLAGVDAAAAALKRLGGVDRLVFVGLRLGATLAALAAARRTDVQSLVAIAPVVSGRAFLREARILQAHATADAAAGMDVSDLWLGPAAMEQVSAVALTAQAAMPAPRVLLLDPDDRAAERRWSAHLRGLGGQVEQHVFRADAVWQGEAASAALGGPLRAQIAQWACDGAGWAVGPAPDVAIDDVLQMVEHGRAIRERLVRIDTPGEAPLMGVLAEPALPAGTAAPDALAALVMNTGAGRRAGPSRFNVLLARRLAADGVPTLRLDHSGVGDSPPAADAAPGAVYPVAGVRDAARAAAFLRSLPGVRYCVGTGICSSGYHALRAAVEAAALDRVVAINPMLYMPHDAAEYDAASSHGAAWLRATAQAAVRAEAATGIARRTVRRAIGALAAVGNGVARLWRRGPGLGRALRQTAMRGVDLQFVFGQGEVGLPMLRQQGGRALQRLLARQQVGLHVLAPPEIDHILSRSAARWAVLDHVRALVARPVHPPVASQAAAAWRRRRRSASRGRSAHPMAG